MCWDQQKILHWLNPSYLIFRYRTTIFKVISAVSNVSLWLLPDAEEPCCSLWWQMAQRIYFHFYKTFFRFVFGATQDVCDAAEWLKEIFSSLEESGWFIPAPLLTNSVLTPNYSESVFCFILVFPFKTVLLKPLVVLCVSQQCWGPSEFILMEEQALCFLIIHTIDFFFPLSVFLQSPAAFANYNANPNWAALGSIFLIQPHHFCPPRSLYATHNSL